MSKLTITRNDGVASVVMNNPSVNILTIDLINEVNAFVLSLQDDRDTKVVIFTSSHDEFFLAHLDLNINEEPRSKLTGYRRVRRV